MSDGILSSKELTSQMGGCALTAGVAGMTKELTKVGRLAMRHEGENWNAYYALPDSMKEPIFLGSIRMGAVADNPERKQAFMMMMRDIVSDIIEASTGIRPTWGGPQSAPDHERAGQG